MITRDLLKYIQEQIAIGTKRKKIKNFLIKNKWQEQDILEAFDVIDLFIRNEASNISLPNVSRLQESSSTKKVLTSFVIVAFFILIGYGAFEYINYSYDIKTPEEIIRNAVSNINKTKSFEYVATVKIKNKPNIDNDFQPVNISISDPQQRQWGNNDISINSFGIIDNYNIIKKGKFNFDINANKLSSLEKSPVSIEARTFNNITYFKIDNVPNFLLDLNGAKNQWIRYDNRLSNKEFLLSKLENQVEALLAKQSLSASNGGKFKMALLEANIINKANNLDIQNINGIDMYHYKFILDSYDSKKVLFYAREISNGAILFNNKISEFDFEDDEINSSAAEIWIDKENRLPHKINLIIDYGKNIIQIPKEVSLEISFKNFNQENKIELPDNSHILENFIEELLPRELGKFFAN